MSSLDLERLRADFPDRRIQFYPSINSTMHAAAGLPLGSVVLAGEQTAGQGRHGHSWHSTAGEGIYCSIVLEPAPVLTLALGLATADAIGAASGLACDLRWPNDVLLAGKKVAGILVQLAEGLAIAGIGINLNQTSFPSDLEALATSIAMNTGRAVPATDLLAALLRAVDTYTREDKNDILRLFAHASSYVAGRRVTVDLPDGAVTGITAGLDSDGYLIVRKDDGTDTLVLAGGVRAAGA